MAGFLGRDEGGNAGMLSVIRDRLASLSSLGVKYDDKVVKNSMAFGVAEERAIKQGLYLDDAAMYTMAMADIGPKKADVYFDKQYKERREFLRKFSMNGEVQWILDTITDEAIVQDERQFFCYSTPLAEDMADEIKEAYDENFKKIYTHFHFNDDITAWQYMYQFLVDGILAFEIIWDDKAKNIIGFKELDPTSMKQVAEKQIDGTFKNIWYQNYEDPRMRRSLTDAQLIYISFAKGSSLQRLSYVERLVRSFNLLRIMEHTRVIWAVMNSTFRMKMVVPIGSKSPQRAKESLGELVANYKEDVRLDYESGELTVAGRPHIPFYKNYVYPSKNGESIEMATLGGEGPDLSDMTQLDYFYNKLKKDSKVPAARFDNATGGGQFAFGVDGIDREEVRFSKFINRLRSIFQEIVTKPLYVQMVRQFPGLEGDESFKAQVGIRFNKDNQFEREKEMKVLTDTAEFISSMSEIKTIRDGKEMPFYHPRFLINKYMQLSHSEIQENEDMWQKYGLAEAMGDAGFDGQGFGGGDEPDAGIDTPVGDEEIDFTDTGAEDAAEPGAEGLDLGADDTETTEAPEA